jgi:glutamyl-Q tRNA(Asp) synthetase
VLARKDGVISYHLAVTVDDALQGITMVTRGNDLFPSTHVHRLLQTLLGLPAPTYRHHRLIMDENGKRLAKRDQATSLRHLKSLGVTPAEILDRLGLTSR